MMALLVSKKTSPILRIQAYFQKLMTKVYLKLEEEGNLGEILMKILRE
jgi:hypothetical protein